MSDESQDRTIKIISDHHGQIATFARKSYELDGRGAIQVGFPNVPPGRTAVGVGIMKSVALAELHRLAPADEEMAVLVRMVETYDPMKQAVVLAAIDGELSISIKMKLDPPFVVDTADGVQ